MPARRTNLDFAAFTLGGTAMITQLRSFGFDPKIMTDQGASIAAYPGRKVPVKRENRFSATVLRDNSGRQTNLNITAFTLGSLDAIGRIVSGSLKVKNVFQDGAAAPQFDQYAQYCGMDVCTIEGTMLVSTGTLTGISEVEIVGESAAASQLVTCTIAAGNVGVASLPFVYTGAPLKIENRKIQEYNVSLEGNHAPTDSPVITGTLLSVAYSNSPIFSSNTLTTGGHTFASVNLGIEDYELKFENSKIIEEILGLVVLGTGTADAISIVPAT